MNTAHIRLLAFVTYCFLLFVGMNAAAQADGNAKNEAFNTQSAPVEKLKNSEALPPEVFYDSDPKSWARVKRMVTPKYPADALKNGVGGVVDLEVFIDRIGGVKDVRTMTSTPNNPQFEQAINDVIKYWRFGVPQSNRCVPTDSVGEVSLTFEVKAGEGVISLSHRSGKQYAASDILPAPKFLDAKRVANIFAADYPRAARRAGATAQVYALLTINSASGKATNAEVTHIITADGFESLFKEAAEPALMTIRHPPFHPKSSEQSGDWTKCVVISYRLKGESSE
jgi:TonB family protein